MRSSLVVTICASVTAMSVIIVVTLVVTLSTDTGGPVNYRHRLIDTIDNATIDHFLRNLTQKPHPTGSEGDKEVWAYVEEVWRQQGYTNVRRESYQVVISIINSTNPNKVSMVRPNGTTSWSATTHQPSDKNDTLFYNYNGFSASAIVQKARVVYVNYGLEEDYGELNETEVTLSGSIFIMRYGQNFRGDKVRSAERRGAAAVLLYSDPADVRLGGTNTTTYPDSVYAPPDAVQLGSLRLQGDLRTPGYPAFDWAYHLPESEWDLPTIPVHPLSYQDASHILSLMEGDEAPPHWQGGLDLVYRLGPGLVDGERIRIETNNANEVTTLTNVMTMIEGSQEPDRYVVLGNHHDAWTYGGVDPSSATASLLEVSRSFASLYNHGWRPVRTLVFCAWGGEEQGILGSTEFTEHLGAVLGDRAVVYLNLDMVMEGTYSFNAMGVPHLHEAIFSAAKMVPNPDPVQVAAGNTTLYDTWVLRRPDLEAGGDTPLVDTLGSGSDFRPFFFNLGVPSLNMVFTPEEGEPILPLYHTAYETYHLAATLMDPALLYHQAVARMWAVLAYEFSSQTVLPLDLQAFGSFLQGEWDKFFKEFRTELRRLQVTTDHLKEAVAKLQTASNTFHNKLQTVNTEEPLVARRYNDAMMLMDRCLLSPKGLQDRPLINHVVMAPKWSNGYVWEVFPGLRDLLEPTTLTLDDTVKADRLQEQVAILTHHLNMSAAALTFTPW